MDSKNQKYNLFFKFIEAYSATGFKEIDRDAPLMVEIEEMLTNNKQFFYVGDVINLKIEFSSQSCSNLIGIQAEELNPYHIFTITHPDDLLRHSITRAHIVKLAHLIYVQEKGYKFMSTNLRFKNLQGSYTNFLVQAYTWYSKVPGTVYCLFIKTDISWFGDIRHGHNSYVGDDISYFKYPDEKLIMTGNVFSDREFEILKLIEAGLKSEEIADKLFLSVHTINTHRRRILKKTGSSTMFELLHELKENGAL